MDLEELLLAVRHGEPRAWDELGVALNRELRRYFAKRFDSGIAQDLVQRTVLKVTEKIHDYPTGDAAKFRSWVFTIAFYEVQNARRRLGRERVRSAELVEFRSNGTSPSSYVRRRQEREIARRNLSRVDSRFRRALVHLARGGDAKSLAEREDIEVATVRTRGVRGREQLRELVQAELAGSKRDEESSSASPR